MATIPPALELRDAHAGYGRAEVLRGVDLVVPAGCVFALVGRNGVGKTTTMKLADGRLRPTAGCVHVAGVHVNDVPPEYRARAGVCSVPERGGIFTHLSVVENLRLPGRSRRAAAASVERALDQFPILAQRRSQAAGTLSGGEQRMLALGRALASDPTLLLVDELSSGLAPHVVEELYGVLAGLPAGGVTVVIVDQFPRAALAVAHYAALIAGGRVQQVGEAVDLDGLADAYLGAVARG